ncbi:MAG TPA: metallophosphoesterase [Bryobacteraceae bacterium]|nr:metallophosphoesterase [Bryobacteraceae bacterium]
MRFLSLLLPSLLLHAASPFLVEPYLQLGDARGLQKSETMALLWQTPADSSGWSVEVKAGPIWKKGPGWRKTAAPSNRRVAVEGIEPHVVWRATLAGLIPGEEFQYRLLESGKAVFTSHARARKSANQPFRFVAFGDCGAGTGDQKKIAALAQKQDPDFVFIPGDIVYTRGRIAEYRQRFYPVYGPMMANILFVGAVGNHDSGNRDLSSAPDALAYFYYWAQPLNGPSHSSFDALSGPEGAQNAFRSAADVNFPRMANFSFDYGNSHWLILDSNPYAEWTDPALRRWVADDLAATRATWKFVGFHHPGFNSSKAHHEDQWMRTLSDVFEAQGVDVVISGHVHNYQRTYPLTFRMKGTPQMPVKEVAGDWTLDKSFDGDKNTTPKGVIYLITGAGGADLYDTAQGGDPSSWLDFTAKFVSRVHSFTVADIAGRTAKFRQISADGDTLDSFTITK